MGVATIRLPPCYTFIKRNGGAPESPTGSKKMINLNRALLKSFDHNGRMNVGIVNDDRSLTVEQMQQWVDRMNEYIKRTGAYDKGARYYLG